jgi:hypothetical protein
MEACPTAHSGCTTRWERPQAMRLCYAQRGAVLWILLTVSGALGADVETERLALQADLRRRHQQLTALPDAQRGPGLAELRRLSFEGHARLAQRFQQPSDAVTALKALADLEQAQVQPVREVACPEGASVADCVAARVGVAPTVLSDTTFTVFLPAGADEVRIVTGRSDHRTLHLQAEVRRADPLLASTVSWLASQGLQVHELVPPLQVMGGYGGRLRLVSDGWLGDTEPLQHTDLALCLTEQGLQVSVPSGAVGRLLAEEAYTGRLWTLYTQPMPCRWGFVVGADLGVTPGRKLAYPLGTGGPELAPGPPFVPQTDGGLVRSRTFGKVTLTERVPPGRQIPDGIVCELAHPSGSMAMTTRSGCTVLLAAQLDEDGVADFILRTMGEACEANTLWMSRPDGWASVATFGGC